MITEQLKSYCGCVDVNEDDVAEMINIVSAMTCWRRRGCETFLKSERKEIIDLKSCHECGFTFEPFYHPYDKDTFKFYIVTVDGINETTEEITEYAYSETEELFRLDLGMECECNKCGCAKTHKLLVTYTAGYEELPDCILPVFCNILEVIKAKNTCDCTCSCENDGNEEDITYAKGDVVTVQLETDIGKMLVEAYKNDISKISLCGGVNTLWGAVV